jgi:hypothetical protein
VTATSTSCRLGIVIAGAPAGFGVLNARILLLPRPVVKDYVKDYACPFYFFYFFYFFRQGLCLSFLLLWSSRITSRIMPVLLLLTFVLPRPVVKDYVKDYACPFY